MYEKLSDDGIEKLVKGIEGAFASLEEAAKFPMALDMTISELRNFGFEAEAQALQKHVRQPQERGSEAEMLGAAIFQAKVDPKIVDTNRRRLTASQIARIRKATRNLSGSGSGAGTVIGCLLTITIVGGIAFGVYYFFFQ